MNLGDLTFGYGLDEGQEVQAGVIGLMDRDQYNRRWQQYGGDNPAFDCDGEFEI